MPAGRPEIPAALARAVLVEAGHRCAITRCRSTPVDLCHIIPWATVREHTFENLIALCPTCHRRFDSGEIDRKAMRQYKANMAVLRSRYSDVELRLLKLFANEVVVVSMPPASYVLVMHLVDDGLVERVEPPGIPSSLDQTESYALTRAGGTMVRRLVEAESIDP